MHIVEYDEVRSKLDEVKDACNFIPDTTTKDGYEKSKRVALDVGKLLTTLEKKRKEKKAYFLEGGKQVDSQAKAILIELEQYQLPHKEAYKELDNLRKEREAKRKEDLENRVRFMRELADNMSESCSEEIRGAMEQMNSEECLDFYEYSMQALEARNAARGALAELYTKKVQEEKDAVELAKLRAAEAERAQKERDDQIRKDAAEKADKEKREAIAREEAAQTRALEADRQREVQAEAAEQARIAAEAKALQDVIDAADKARHAENARQAAEIEQKRVEQEQREANTKHIGNIRREAKEDLMSVGMDESLAKKIILAIHSKAIRNISIGY